MIVMVITFLVVLVLVHSQPAKDDFGQVREPESLMDQNEFDDMIAHYIGGVGE